MLCGGSNSLKITGLANNMVVLVVHVTRQTQQKGKISSDQTSLSLITSPLIPGTTTGKPINPGLSVNRRERWRRNADPGGKEQARRGGAVRQ
jgi:hypothetical protein